MITVHCLECDSDLNLEDGVGLGQKVTCMYCSSEFEVVALEPLEIDWADEEDTELTDGLEDDEDLLHDELVDDLEDDDLVNDGLEETDEEDPVIAPIRPAARKPRRAGLEEEEIDDELEEDELEDDLDEDELEDDDWDDSDDFDDDDADDYDDDDEWEWDDDEEDRWS